MLIRQDRRRGDSREGGKVEGTMMEIKDKELVEWQGCDIFWNERRVCHLEVDCRKSGKLWRAWTLRIHSKVVRIYGGSHAWPTQKVETTRTLNKTAMGSDVEGGKGWRNCCTQLYGRCFLQVPMLQGPQWLHSVRVEAIDHPKLV
eukprot:c18980_g1_i2 orf=89-523(+)